jgi:hypothetical protein
MLQLYFKDDNPLKLTKVISEHYEELEFHNPSQDLSDALLSHPWEDLEKPSPNPRFNPEEQEKEQKALQEGLEKLLAEYEITKQRIPKLEQVRCAFELSNCVRLIQRLRKNIIKIPICAFQVIIIKRILGRRIQ